MILRVVYKEDRDVVRRHGAAGGRWVRPHRQEAFRHRHERAVRAGDQGAAVVECPYVERVHARPARLWLPHHVSRRRRGQPRHGRCGREGPWLRDAAPRTRSTCVRLPRSSASTDALPPSGGRGIRGRRLDVEAGLHTCRTGVRRGRAFRRPFLLSSALRVRALPCPREGLRPPDHRVSFAGSLNAVSARSASASPAAALAKAGPGLRQSMNSLLPE